ncbi:hypothetical protein [Nitrosopumilus sp. b3]|nr:hypothetical protein [Nitrosopumilus sp. b3]
MSFSSIVTCIVCNSNARIIEVKKYNGLRGFCSNCGGNWPES